MQTKRRSLLLALAGMALARRGAAKALHKSDVAGDPSVPGVLLANPYSASVDPTAYLVSEKFDGVRGLWDGTTLRFRSGRTVPAPTWFTARLPRNQALDGELWVGHGQFEAASAAVRRDVPVDAEWQRVHYMIFELPTSPGTFAERAARIPAIVRAAAWPQLVAVEQTRVSSRDELQHRLDAVVSIGGEGLALHLAAAPIASGRSDVLLKLKPSQDAEATVVGHRPGKGKYAGLVGSLDVRTDDGRRFLIGSGLSDALRHDPPAIGSVVTYRYRDLTSTGLPRFATFLRMHDAL